LCLQESDLARLHNDAIKNDPFISAALGPSPKVLQTRGQHIVHGHERMVWLDADLRSGASAVQIERMKAAALRLGSQGLSTSYDDHLLIIGDAAGHIDPLTGEGIHTAIMVRCCVSMLDLGKHSNVW
jgi:menaquinone-9 beta-reductase